MKTKTFEHIISLGEACFVASMLNDVDKRKFSSPFDWICGGNLQTRFDLILNDFAGFIDKEDLTLGPELSPSEAYHMYINMKNGLTFNHDILKDIPFDEGYAQAKEKYDRRIERFLNTLTHSKSVLLLYFDMLSTENRKLSKDKLIEYLVRINTKFPNCFIHLLYFQAKEKPKEEFINVNKYLTLTEYTGAITGPILDLVKNK